MAKVVNELEGKVVRTGSGRFWLEGREEALRLSRWCEAGTEVPPVGAVVRVGLDRDGWVRSVVVLEASSNGTGPEQTTPRPQVTGRPQGISSRYRMRLEALRLAVDLARGGLEEADAEKVLKVAERFERWLRG